MSDKGCLQVQCDEGKHIRMYEFMKAWDIFSRSQAPSIFEYCDYARKCINVLEHIREHLVRQWRVRNVKVIQMISRNDANMI